MANDNVKKLVEELAGSKTERKEEKNYVDLSIRIDIPINERLKKVASKIGVSKNHLLARLMPGIVADLEESTKDL